MFNTFPTKVYLPHLYQEFDLPQLPLLHEIHFTRFKESLIGGGKSLEFAPGEVSLSSEFKCVISSTHKATHKVM